MNLSAGTWPGVSYIMPILNEANHVEAAVVSLLAQEYPGPVEVALAVGPSTDGTSELVHRLAAEDPRITVVDNPVGSTPNGLNAAIRASRHPVIVRVDAHSVLPAGYTRLAVETLQRTGAANVGGVMHAQGVTPFEKAVAAAYGSRVGLGGTKLHRGGEEGPSETVYLGVFDRDQITDAGLFDEYFKRGQDWELNRRLREAGKVVWFNPELSVVYRPRSSWERLARQFLSTGMWRGEIARRFPSANGLRYFAAPAAVVANLVGVTTAAAGAVVTARTGRHSPLLLGAAAPVGYAAMVSAAAVPVVRQEGWQAALRYPGVLAVMHGAWGTGFVLGYFGLRDVTTQTGR